ncbi:alpha/beta hydrolase [Derxia gummosa]|uniref:Alpha/beta hydrolase n=1 Tax=Derxia gummosa DSM 723 TaxID=1121388 RepID=A0A8B6X8Y8_9BURK|nr:alpha/beta hydrolase [Derxia gummosa]
MCANSPASLDRSPAPTRRRLLGALAAVLALDARPARASGVTTTYPARLRPPAATDRGEPVELDLPDGRLAGSLLLPAHLGLGASPDATAVDADAAARPPLVILAAGSGPVDRDGNSRAGLRTDAYLLLARALARAGIATLRHDKRGVGESLNAVRDPDALGIDDYARDLARWSALMHSEYGFGRIVLAGHSEGALVATLAAREAPIGGVALVCGTGRRIGALLRDQLAPRLDAGARADLDAVLADLEAGHAPARLPASLDPWGEALFGGASGSYLMRWMRHDPAADLAALDLPALIVHGSTDRQLWPDDRATLLAARPDASARLIDGMCHVLKPAGADSASQARAYHDASLPVMPDLVASLARFAAG